MAGDSLGTMTVGVTANVSDAERALNGLANMLERFDRQQQNRQRSSASRHPSFAGLPKYGPYSEEQQFAEMLRKEQVQKEALTKWMFNETRKSEQVAVQVGGTESHMQMLGGKFKHDQRIAAEREALAQQEFNNQEARNGLLLNNHMAMLSAKFKEDQRIAAEREALSQQEFNNQQAHNGLLLNNHMAMLSAKFKEEQRIAAEREALAQQEFDNQHARNGLLLNNHMAMLSAKFKEDQRIAAEREALAQQEQERTGRLLDLHMHQLGQQFKSGAFNGVTNSASQAKYAIMNLAYGVQDAATVFEHGGFLGAIRASANNMQGLAILFDRAAIKAGGLAAAIAEPEFKVIAFATTLMIGASALEKYIAAQKKAAEESSKLALAHIDPSSAIAEAGRKVEFQQQLRDIKELSDAEGLIKEKQDQKNADKARIQENLRQQQMLKKQIENEEFRVNMIQEIAERAQRQAQQRAMRSAPVMGEPTPGAALTADEQELLKGENILIAQEEIASLKKELVETEKDHAKALRESAVVAKELADAQKNLGKLQEAWKIDELNRQKDLWQEYERTQMKEKESDIEYRIGFLRKRRDQIVDKSRKQMQPVGVASFESAEAYEALARSRMKQDPQTDLLQKIVKEEEKATKALEDIREQLDPGRRAKIAVLEKL